MCSTRVLLVGLTTPEGDALEAALGRVRLEVSRARSAPDLWTRLAHLGFEPPTLVFVDLTLPETLEDGFFGTLRRALPAASQVAVAERVEGERAARLLGLGVPSLSLPASPDALVDLALKLSFRAPLAVVLEPRTRSDTGDLGELASALDAYAVRRSLSGQQRAILGLYLAGNNDKAIAELCGCALATVYEHWRRMAKKAGATHKADVIADFHRFLTHGAKVSEFHGQGSEFS
ncbi:MAG TPA: LuxR C-terminal-related transcriptional regulator [Polyangiaceae bacterium]|nr:LuxR C-terminal-related transcriptional regulator [Polyangiaceae bacterium]